MPQDLQFKALGRIVATQNIKNGVYCRTSDNKYVRVCICDVGTVQVHIDTDKMAEPNDAVFSYAVQNSGLPTEFTIQETANEIVLLTSGMRVLIEKPAFAIHLQTVDGKAVCQDEKGLATGYMGHRICMHKKLQADEVFIGLGEKTGPLNRRGHQFVHWNTDWFGYGVNDDPIYASIPFYIGLHNELCYGLFLDNSYKSYFNFGASNHRFSSISVEGGAMNYYLFLYDSPLQIIQAYSRLTGFMPLPPKWALGYQQCRYSYYPDTELHSIAQNFRNRAIPCDVLYLDIHYMDSYRVFTFNEERFPEPKKMVEALQAKGFETVVIADPGIATPDAENEDAALFVQYPDGQAYTADVWPGRCYFPDFTNPATRKWWAAKVSFYTDKGITGIWNDMNEPASWGQATPDCLQFNGDGATTTHLAARNVYGMLMARASRHGLATAAPDKRPFVLTRAAFSGIQTTAAVWTGDNQATDEHMLLACRQVMGLGLSGVPFSGCDIGGFIGDCTPALFARWFSIGALSPFFRGHSMINSKAAEPWAFGEMVEEICANYARLRYRLMPYLYACFAEAAFTATPIARSLALDYPFHKKVYLAAYQNQFLLGPSLLICPVASDQLISEVFLPPQEIWYSLFTDVIYKGNTTPFVASPITNLPIFVKGGAILFMQSLVQSIGTEKPNTTLVLHVYNGISPTATSFTYYEDDGCSPSYSEGDYYRRQFVHQPKNRQLQIKAVEGSYPSHFKKLRIYLHNYTQIDAPKGTSIQYQNYNFIQAISKFDPLEPAQAASEVQIVNLAFIELDLTDEPMQINW